MKFFFSIVLSCLSVIVNAQDAKQGGQQPKNIFRAGITVPVGVSLNGAWEKKLSETFTLTTKASLFAHFGNLAFGRSNGDVLLATIFEIDARYYYNIKRRARKKKDTRNFSASYFSLNPYTASRPLLDGPHPLDYEGNNGIFLNWGVQKQLKKRFYLNAYVGALIASRSFKADRAAAIDPAHLGLTIGYVIN